jgi:uncharacterized protein YeaO (DUF488 family)
LKKKPGLIQLKRVYEESSPADGLRILVERLWPRGVSKEKASVDLWLKDLAPSTELRKWFHEDPGRWDEFRKRYWSELGEKGDLLLLLKHRASEGSVTFIYAASNEEHNSAFLLKEYLEKST